MAAASVAAVLAVGTLSVPSSFADGPKADDLKSRQRKVDKHIDHAHHALDESSKRLTTANARLDDARSQLATARNELAAARGRVAVAAERDAQMQAALAQAEADLATAEAELAAGQQNMDDQAAEVASTVSDIYMEGDPQLLAFSSMLESASTDDLTRHDEVRDVIVGREARAFDALHAAKVLLEVHERQVEEARDDVAVKRQQAADNLVVKQQLESEAETAKASVSALVGERSAARAEASKARAADLRQLQQLERESDRIEEMLRRRAAAALRRARARAAARAAANNAAHGRSAPSGGGTLMMPVAGGMTSPFGWRIHPIYGYWGLHDGADFGGGCGQPIHAAASGRVVSSYWSDVYGHRLIIDNGVLRGTGIATIYNHASTYTVGTGAQVQRGQVIGYVGDTGWSTACHLHFTVMANGTAVDPANWF
jgi:murein DD-endopeptidase MepM/ murein hydrolase activator NlpD